VDAWGYYGYRHQTGIKVGHVANASHVLASMGPAGSARAFVERKYAWLQGGQTFVNLATLATLLDARVAQCMAQGYPQQAMEADEIVETVCSEIMAVDYYLITNDHVGEDVLRAVTSGSEFLASNAARSRAAAAAKEAHKLAEYKAPRRRGGRGGKGSDRKDDKDEDGGKASAPRGAPGARP